MPLNRGREGFLIFGTLVALLLQSATVACSGQQMVLWYFSCHTCTNTHTHTLCWHLKPVDVNGELEHDQKIEFTDKSVLTSKSGVFYAAETLDYITKTSPMPAVVSRWEHCLHECVCERG